MLMETLGVELTSGGTCGAVDVARSMGRDFVRFVMDNDCGLVSGHLLA
jgi:hypothetical protein